MGLNDLKEKYNYWNGRYKKAEEYFRTHEIEECDKYVSLVNEILRELSLTQIEIEKLIKMTDDQKENGFKEIK